MKNNLSRIERINLGIKNLTKALDSIREVNNNVPSMYIPTNPIRHKISALKIMKKMEEKRLQGFDLHEQ